MEEEPSHPPISKAYRRMEVEKFYEAIQKIQDEIGQGSGQGSSYKKKEKLANPKHHTKKREDPRAMTTREEREEMAPKKNLKLKGEAFKKSTKRLKKRKEGRRERWKSSQKKCKMQKKI